MRDNLFWESQKMRHVFVQIFTTKKMYENHLSRTVGSKLRLQNEMHFFKECD